MVALAIGLEDYTADIGAARTLVGTESFWARAQVLNGARAAGVQPIDTVFSDVGDMAGLRESVIEVVQSEEFAPLHVRAASSVRLVTDDDPEAAETAPVETE